MDAFDASDIGNKQRVFRAKCKLNQAGVISHITQRAAGKEPLFLESEDYLTMLSLFKECAERFRVFFYGLCLMSNHIHVLIEPQEANLAEAMHGIFSRYAMRFNRKYERRGHLFGGRYRQAICLDLSYLLAASVYIHLNPVRAGVTERAIDYRWSSCRLYCQDEDVASFVDPKPVLRILDEDISKAKQDYSNILSGGQGAEPQNALEQEGAIEKFCIRLAGLFPQIFRRIAEKSSQRETANSTMDVLDITRLETLFHEAQLNKTSPRLENRRVLKYVMEQLIARGFTKSDIAERFGLSRKTVYNVLQTEFPVTDPRQGTE